MSKCSNVWRVVAVALLASLVLQASAQAHALFADHDPNRPVAEYLWLGFVHMAGGWDHLAFIAGVVLFAGSVRPAAKLISLFVAGHSLTLVLATLAGWQLNAAAVDVVIALSLVFVGVWGLRGARDSWLLGGLVFGFGLVHGLGLSTRLQDLALPEDGVLVRVVVFNVGVELGQLAALAAIFALGRLVVRRFELGERDARPAYLTLVAMGVLAAAVLSFPSAPTADPQAQARTCREQGTSPPRALAGGHPERFYFAPDEPARIEDLDHVVADGLVVVRYRPDLDAADHRTIERFVADTEPPYVVAAPDPDQDEPVRAVAASRTMVCSEVVRAELETFRDEWLAEAEQKRTG
jgi:hydrogenase/urease accessory protein HupE